MRKLGPKFFWLLFLIAACGEIEPISLPSLIDQQPKVVSIVPIDGENFAGDVVEVTFNQPIDSKTVTNKSFLITAVEETPDIAALWDKAKDGDVSTHPGTFEISEDQKTVRFKAQEPFPPAIRCGVLITPEVLSVDRLPLNQTPGEGPTPFFSSFYALGGGDEEGTGSSQSADLPATLSRPSYLMLNEVFYDAVGGDTNGDLFIELNGEPEKNLSGYQIIFVRGDDGVILDSLRIPNGMRTNAEGFFVIADAITNQPGQTYVQNADWVANFDPPNGPDCLQLVDPEGSLADVLGYGSPLVLRAQNNLLCYDGEPAPDAPSGSSLTRPAENQDTDNDVGDWTINSSPSPGIP